MNNDFAKRHQKSVHEFYETHGSSFAKTRGDIWPEQILLAKTIHPEMTVIDIGAGNGRFNGILPKDVAYLGVEPSKSLREASHVKLLPGELPHLLIQDNIGDLTACFAVLHHIPTVELRQASIREIIRVTKPNGRLAVSAWYIPEGKFEEVKDSEDNDVWIPWKADQKTVRRFVHRFTELEWKKLWTRPELEIEQIGLFGREDWTKNTDEARNFFVMAKKKSA